MKNYIDSDGYPTERALNKIKNWKFKGEKSCEELFEFIEELWRWPDYFKEEEGIYQISTGGWSGNEDLIGA